MNSLILASVLNFFHLFATVAWFGAMTTNAFILMPSIGTTLEPPVAGKLMGAVMKRFRIVVYASIVVLIVTGILMTDGMKFMQFTSLWSIIYSIKHIFIIIVDHRIPHWSGRGIYHYDSNWDIGSYLNHCKACY